MSKSFISVILISLSSFFIAICAQLSISIAFIPLTGQTLGIGIISTALGQKKGCYAIMIYLGLGIIGLPVFANAQGGLNILTGATGGYLISFIIYGWLIGHLLERTKFNYYRAICANILATLMTLFIGSMWLKFVVNLNWSNAFYHGFLPFILPGIIKAIIAAVIGIICHRWLIHIYHQK